MKKIFLYLLPIIILGVACTDNNIDKNLAPPQTNPEDPAFTIGFQADNAEPAYDMAAIQTDSVAIAKISSLDIPAGASVAYKVQVSKTGDSTAVPLIYSASYNANLLNIATADLQDVVEKLYGKRPDARNLSFVINASVTSADQTFLMKSNALNIAVTPTAPVIDSAYYLIGDVNNWSFDDLDSYKFSHSAQDVYDDPVFSITTQMSGNFKIVPQSAIATQDWSVVLGNPVDQNTDLTGTLGIGANYSGSMKVAESQMVRITINMMDYTYTIQLLGNALQQLYVPGGHNNWDVTSAPIVYSPDLDWKFDGYVYMEAGNEFKFTPAPNWDTAYGDAGDGTLSTSGGNLSVAETGFYRLTVDLSKEPYTYTATATNWGLIGDATVGGWDTSTPMTLNTATGEWTATATLSAAGTFKFRANDGWDINLGGDVNKLTYGGDNIPVASDGTYLITLKLGNATAYTCTVVKQ
jgi:hypothetical protein